MFFYLILTTIILADTIITVIYNTQILFLTRILFYQITLSNLDIENKLPKLFITSFFIIAQYYLAYSNYTYIKSIIIITVLFSFTLLSMKAKKILVVNKFISIVIMSIYFVLNYYLVDYLIFKQNRFDLGIDTLNFLSIIITGLTYKPR